MAIQVLFVSGSEKSDRIRTLLGGRRGIELSARAENAEQAREQAGRIQPSVAIIETAAAGLDAIEITRQIVSVSPETRVLAISVHSDPEFVQQILRAGARGFLLRNRATDELIPAIEALAEGHTYLSVSQPDIDVFDYLLCPSCA